MAIPPLYDHHGHEIDLAQVAREYQHRKIEGIKYLRDLTGWGLKETKDALDAYWDVPPTAPAPPLNPNGPRTEFPPPKRRWIPCLLLVLTAILLFLYFTLGRG